jgi:integrase
VATYQVSKRRQAGAELPGWQVTVNYGTYRDERGRLHRPRDVRQFRLKAEAEDYGQRRIEYANAGRIVRPGRLTVRDLLIDWRDRWVRQPGRIAPKTREAYEQMLETHLLPGLGTVRLTALTPAVIEDYLEGAGRGDKPPIGCKSSGRGPLAPATVRKLASLLSLACDRGVRRGVLPRNPVKDVELPPMPRRPPRPVLSTARMAELLELCHESSPLILYPFVLLAVATGMRREEVLALRWSDVDLRTGAVAVRRALVYAGGELHFGPTKTRAGQRGSRPLVLPQFARDALRAERQVQNVLRIRAGAGWRPHDLICCRPDGRPHVPNTLSGELRRFGARHGFPGLGPHVLRRSWITALRMRGVDAKLVSEAAGHASTRTTEDIYVQVTDAAREALAGQVDALFAAAGAESRQQPANIEASQAEAAEAAAPDN